eukprot:5763165-Pleurochrysis_carterae.AAC.2
MSAQGGLLRLSFPPEWNCAFGSVDCGLCLQKVTAELCPPDPDNLPRCSQYLGGMHTTTIGSMCEGATECGTDPVADNCQPGVNARSTSSFHTK